MVYVKERMRLGLRAPNREWADKCLRGFLRVAAPGVKCARGYVVCGEGSDLEEPLGELDVGRGLSATFVHGLLSLEGFCGRVVAKSHQLACISGCLSDSALLLLERLVSLASLLLAHVNEARNDAEDERGCAGG